MFCIKCGKEMKDDDAFCMNCGAPASSAGQPESVTANSPEGGAAIKRSGSRTMLILAIMIAVFFAVLIAFFRIVQGLRDSDDAGGDTGGAKEKPFAGFSGISVGDRVVFGRYEQDSITSNGAEPLEWDVIGKNGSQYMLITHYVIDCMQYDDGMADTSVNAGGSATDAEVTWAKCSLRKWLNADFYTNAFTDEERSYIATVSNHNSSWLDFDDGKLGASSSIKKGGYGGASTQDKVFLLSLEEIPVYLGPMVYRTEYVRDFFPGAIASATIYAQTKIDWYNIYGMDDLFGDAASRENPNNVWRTYYDGYVDQDYIEKEALVAWFTRSPGCYDNGTAALAILGDGGPKPGYLKSDFCGIRPVVWVNAG